MKKKGPVSIFPFLEWLPKVNRHTMWADLLAGITGAVIVLPQGVAFAMIAGMPPIYGLYTAMVTPVIAALFGSSYHLISGPTTAISIVVFSSISSFAEPGTAEFVQYALVLTFLAGLFQFALGAVRMGVLVNFVSHTVVIGFTAGAAILIGVSQLKHVLGVDIPKTNSFLEILYQLFLHFDQINLLVVGVALATLLTTILSKRFFPKLPHMLIGMVVGSVLALLLDGAEKGVRLVGEMPAQLPPFRIPDLTYVNFQMLGPDAFAVALLGLIEAVAIGRAIATHTHQRINGNQEFVGQGLSNLVGSFFSCYAGSGSFTRSGVNYEAGAKTPMAALFAAGLLLLIVLFIAPLTAYLPIPAMAGIILVVAYNLIDIKHIRQIIRASRVETAVLGVTFASTLLLDLEFAIYAGVIFSLIFYLQRTSRPNIAIMAPDPDDDRRQFTYTKRKPELKQCPQLKIVRIDGSLYYGAVDHVSAFFEGLYEGREKYVLIVAEGINFIDLAGAEWLVNEAQKWRLKGGDLFICGLKRVSQGVLMKGGFKATIGEDHFFTSKQQAIQSIFSKLDKNICQSCEARIFEEC